MMSCTSYDTYPGIVINRAKFYVNMPNSCNGVKTEREEPRQSRALSSPGRAPTQLCQVNNIESVQPAATTSAMSYLQDYKWQVCTKRGHRPYTPIPDYSTLLSIKASLGALYHFTYFIRFFK